MFSQITRKKKWVVALSKTIFNSVWMNSLLLQLELHSGTVGKIQYMYVKQ